MECTIGPRRNPIQYEFVVQCKDWSIGIWNLLIELMVKYALIAEHFWKDKGQRVFFLSSLYIFFYLSRNF
jgi:hypothetical protein